MAAIPTAKQIELAFERRHRIAAQRSGDGGALRPLIALWIVNFQCVGDCSRSQTAARHEDQTSNDRRLNIGYSNGLGSQRRPRIRDRIIAFGATGNTVWSLATNGKEPIVISCPCQPSARGE